MPITLAFHTLWRAIIDQLCLWKHNVLFYLFLWTNKQLLTGLAKKLTSIKAGKELVYSIISKFRCEALIFCCGKNGHFFMDLKKWHKQRDFQNDFVSQGTSLSRLWHWELTVLMYRISCRFIYQNETVQGRGEGAGYMSVWSDSLSCFLGLSYQWKMFHLVFGGFVSFCKAQADINPVQLNLKVVIDKWA